MPVAICTASELNAAAKSQTVRLLDVFVIGPLMVVGGIRAGGLVGLALAGFGVSAMFYNADNYRRIGAALSAEAGKLTTPAPPA